MIRDYGNGALAGTINLVSILHKQERVIIEITEVPDIRSGRYVGTSTTMIQISLTLLSNTTCMVEAIRVEKSTAQRKVSECTTSLTGVLTPELKRHILRYLLELCLSHSCRYRQERTHDTLPKNTCVERAVRCTSG